MPEAKTPNLFQRLLAITSEIGKIEKTGYNSSQKYNFIEQAQLVAELRPQLVKHGVMIIPETLNRTSDRYTKMVPGYNKGDEPKEQATFHSNVVSRYTLINTDNPDDMMVCVWDAGEALDTSDKATNKAITASQKSFLMKLFNISDKEDTENHSPEVPVKAPVKKVESKPELIHPDKLTELRNLMLDQGLVADKATQYVKVLLGKEKPETNDDADKLIAALKGE